MSRVLFETPRLRLLDDGRLLFRPVDPDADIVPIGTIDGWIDEPDEWDRRHEAELEILRANWRATPSRAEIEAEWNAVYLRGIM